MSCRQHRWGRHRWRSPHVSISDRRLYRYPSRGRIAGVCAGLAEYFNVSTTMVRCAAVTALIFATWITLIAYVLAIFLLPTRDEVIAENQASPSYDDTAMERERHKQQEFDRNLKEAPRDESLDDRRRMVRQARERLSRIEQRIRNIESYVTSSRFELNKKFRGL